MGPQTLAGRAGTAATLSQAVRRDAPASRRRVAPKTARGGAAAVLDCMLCPGIHAHGRGTAHDRPVH